MTHELDYFANLIHNVNSIEPHDFQALEATDTKVRPAQCTVPPGDQLIIPRGGRNCAARSGAVQQLQLEDAAGDGCGVFCPEHRILAVGAAGEADDDGGILVATVVHPVPVEYRLSASRQNYPPNAVVGDPANAAHRVGEALWCQASKHLDDPGWSAVQAKDEAVWSIQGLVAIS
ncbi:hypothetical protein MW887_011163 [Aspergillus wentii]|nr:hypothetical protein MW887_011163 [Aspergillus wentii]